MLSTRLFFSWIIFFHPCLCASTRAGGTGEAAGVRGAAGAVFFLTVLLHTVTAGALAGSNYTSLA